MTRKADEIALYVTLRQRAPGSEHSGRPGLDFVMDTALFLGIPGKRLYALLLKWAARGWWDYGVTARSGWFTREAPEAIR